MRTYPKAYIYLRGNDPVMDGDFDSAPAYGKVKPGKEALYFRSGFKWYAAPYSAVQRVFRRMDMVYGKLCCGGSTYDVQMLVLILMDGSEMEIHIGDDMQKKAEELYAFIQQMQPRLQYGKPAAR